MAKNKHVPYRTCVICRQTYPKKKLTRVVRLPDNGVKIDETANSPGRGAYLCHQPACWAKASDGRALDKALKTTLTDDERHQIAAFGIQLLSQAKLDT